MKIHHLIHALMVLLAEHPEAKDIDIIMANGIDQVGQTASPDPTFYPATKFQPAQIVFNRKESRL